LWNFHNPEVMERNPKDGGHDIALGSYPAAPCCILCIPPDLYVYIKKPKVLSASKGYDLLFANIPIKKMYGKRRCGGTRSVAFLSVPSVYCLVASAVLSEEDCNSVGLHSPVIRTVRVLLVLTAATPTGGP
jgi:hypothetical protein